MCVIIPVTSTTKNDKEMKTYITSKEEIQEATEEAVSRLLSEQLPALVRKAAQKQWMTTQEAMDYLQVSRRHLQYLRTSRQLPFSKDGRTIRYHVDDLDEFLEKRKVGTKK